MKLTFDEINHTYRLDGVIIPGYSQIAKSMGITDYGNVPDYFLEPARKFGQAGHYATRLWDNQTLNEVTLSEPLIPCLEEYKKFLQDNKVEIISDYIEKPICSVRYRYGITPDRICLIKGELSVFELKFVETMAPGAALQTAAQKMAAEEFYHIKIKKRYGVQISLKEQYKLYPYTNKGDEQTWLCFLGAYNWKEKYAKRNNGT